MAKALRPGTRVLVLTGFYAGRSGRVREIREAGYVLVDLDGGSYTLRAPGEVRTVAELINGPKDPAEAPANG